MYMRRGVSFRRLLLSASPSLMFGSSVLESGAGGGVIVNTSPAAVAG